MTRKRSTGRSGPPTRYWPKSVKRTVTLTPEADALLQDGARANDMSVSDYAEARIRGDRVKTAQPTAGERPGLAIGRRRAG